MKVDYAYVTNRYPEDTIAAGRKAIAFFKSQYGVDFTDIDDMLLLAGNVTRNDGAVTFMNYMGMPQARYNLVAATNALSATKFNNHISDGGWAVLFNREFLSMGKVNEMIPAGSVGVYSKFTVHSVLT